MEGQAEVNKTCSAVIPGKCAAVGAPMNGTLVYQLTDPRTADEFAQCWDKTTGWLAVGLCGVRELSCAAAQGIGLCYPA